MGVSLASAAHAADDFPCIYWSFLERAVTPNGFRVLRPLNRQGWYGDHPNALDHHLSNSHSLVGAPICAAIHDQSQHISALRSSAFGGPPQNLRGRGGLLPRADTTPPAHWPRENCDGPPRQSCRNGPYGTGDP